MEATVAAASGAPGASEPSDAELVARLRGGADIALGELIRRHQIGVFRLLLGLLDNGDDAERACEKVFFDAGRRIDELADPANFYAWALGLAREAAKEIEAARKKAPPAPPKPRPVPRDPRTLVKQQVRDILGELSGDERLALILADLENDSYESIGATLGTSALEAQAVVESARTKFRDAVGRRDIDSDVERPKARPLEPGELLAGRYRIEKSLGQGGMGAVYRALDTQSNTSVAVKVLLPESRQDQTLRSRFQREAEIIRRVEHPHFVRYIDAGQPPGEPEYVVMEFLDGKALSAKLVAEHRLAAERALGLTRQMLEGLGHAHHVGVVHRDVKPDNVLLVEQPENAEFVKILDLGIAKLAGPDDAKRTALTQRGEVFGTPAYMAPEQVRGEEVDGRADLYALSVMLFEMLASRPPFESTTSMGLLAMHLATPPPRLEDVVPNLRAKALLQPLLDRGLAKDPAERFQTAEQFLDEVNRALRAGVDREVLIEPGEAARAGLPPPAGAKPAPERRAPAANPQRIGVSSPQRFGWLAHPSRLLVVILALALAGLALWLAWGYVR